MLKHKVLARYERLFESRRRLFQRITDCDAELLKERPTADKWSVLEILHHVYLAERGTVNYISKKLYFSKEDLPEASLTSHLKTMLLQIVLKTPLKVKAPAGLDAVSGDISLEELRKQWESLDGECQSLITSLNEKQLASQLFRHPFVGRLNMADTLKFMQAHFDHHLRQIEKLIS